MELPRFLFSVGLVALFCNGVLDPDPVRAEAVWISGSTGTWSDPSRWEGAVAPPIGGGTGQVVRFSPEGTVSVTATDDLPGAFLLNELTLENRQPLTIKSASGSSLRFVDQHPTIRTQGRAATISSPIDLGSGTLRVESGPWSSIALNGTITETEPGSRLILAGSDGPLSGSIALNVTNAFTGGVRIESGNVVIGSWGRLVPDQWKLAVVR